MFGKTMKHRKIRENLYFSYCVHQSDLIYKLPQYAMKQTTVSTDVAEAAETAVTATK